VSRPTVGPIQPPLQWIPEVLSPGEVKRQAREYDDSLQSSAEVKKSVAVPPLSHMSTWHRAYLIKHRDNITFTHTTVGLTAIILEIVQIYMYISDR
jgi:hypothetical protein